ncbi:carbonic anhydrase [Andreesenia angusta]|uniref:Carbonic anhydrase n=1 Tax=Andreesenia angusta TaxID=39480 RepID=A0A1S1VA25_9FIRM|nr:carbonic anhydrase [Andreesenia angusta]OHW62579.1 carbonic anhydrase [Andreesenia angusta]
MKKVLSIVSVALISATMFAGCSQEEKKSEEPTETQISTETKDIHSNPEVKTPDEALQLLKDGNARFVNGELANYDLGDEKLAELEKGQKPAAVVITCSDSRTAPEHFLDQGLGDIFVVRVAGNVLDHNEIASVEYAVDHLGTPLVVVLGHDSCGAVNAAVGVHENPEEAHSTEHLDYLISKITPAVEEAKASGAEGDELAEKAIDLNVDNGVKQLQEQSEVIKGKVSSGALKVVGGSYNFSDGSIAWKN